MSGHNYGKRALVFACSLTLAGAAAAAGTNTTPYPSNTGNAGTTSTKSTRDETQDAQRNIDKATQVIQRMTRDPGAAQLLHHAHGVFIVTHFGRVAAGIGGRGGEGVLMVNKDGVWGEPAFYNTGGFSLGAEAGVEGGPIVFVLNGDKAVQSFKQNNNWSLNAEAGLTIIAWSGKAQGSAGKGDVTVWSDTKGLLGAAAISVTDIHFDQHETSAFYGKTMKVADVFAGTGHVPGDKVAELRNVLAGASGGHTAAAESTQSSNTAADTMGTSSASASNKHRGY
ncbi:MAG TPA: lipid-binding SYLF domain-containing protein [Rhizomicrobium sp.]